MAKEFRLIKSCQKFCVDIVEMEGNADKRYKFTICQDIRKMAENVVHLVRRANNLPVGTPKRMEMQEAACELLEDIKDLLWVVGKLLAIGVKREGQIELSIEELQKNIKNWIESDDKQVLPRLDKALRKIAYEYEQSKETCRVVKDYYEKNISDRTLAAYNESMARCRNAQKRFREAQAAYDQTVERLRKRQELFHKDDSILADILDEIEQKRNN